MFNIIMEPNVDAEAVTFVDFTSIKDEIDENLVDVLDQPADYHFVTAEEKVNCTDVDVVEAHPNQETTRCNDADSSNFNGRIKSSADDKRVRKMKLDAKQGKGKKASFNKKIRSKLKNGKKRSSSSKSSTSTARKPKCEYPRLCSGCGHAYKTKQSFWNHKQRCPMLPQNMRANKVDKNGLPIENAASGDFVPRKEYICAHCERRYRKKHNLREHLKNTCRGKPCSKGRLQCWESGCGQAFYKYVDLVQHVMLQHGQDLQIQKLQFPNFSAFNTWKTEESNSKFMYARKITGSKRFSNTKYHYFVCQFNHRNEKKNNNRKTNRRKKDSLVVPNYNCPSRIMVKECENQFLVTYISSHNHELNLANVKYQPLEKETRAYIKTLLELGVTPKRIIEHVRSGVGNPEIDSFLTTKQHFLTLNRIKRMESKLRAKNRARELQQEAESKQNACGDDDCIVPDDTFSVCSVDAIDAGGDAGSTTTTTPSLFSSCDSAPPKETTIPTAAKNTATHSKEPDEVIRTIENNLKKLKGYVHKNSIKEKLSSRISKMIQELCDECESVQVSSSGGASSAAPRQSAARKPRAASTYRKRKAAAPAPAIQTTAAVTVSAATQPLESVSIAVPAVAVATAIGAALPMQQHGAAAAQLMQPIVIHHQQPLGTHHIHQLTASAAAAVAQPVGSAAIDLQQIVNSVVNADGAGDLIDVQPATKCFTPAVTETTDVLKPIFQPFNVNLLALKSVDRYIPAGEQLLLKQVDGCFDVGFLYDTIVNSFLNLICRPLTNVLAADTSITEYVRLHQKVPDVWHCLNWGDIDTLFIPCNPSKKQWILMVVLVKQLEVQILDPTGYCEDAEAILHVYKKYEATIQCWYEVLRNFLGIVQCNVTSPQHSKHPDPVNSGVLVCWYVLQYVNKRNLADCVDPDYAFRQFVFNTIVGNSSPS